MIAGLVSIITPVFNSAKTIAETIASVQMQTYTKWEILIVMDAGTRDNTAEIVNLAVSKDPRIRFFEIKDCRGVSLSRNLALREAQGQFVAFLDSDDLWLAEKLEKQVAAMTSNSATFSCGGYRKINEDGSRIGKLRLPPPLQSYKSLLRNNLVACPTAMFDQKALGRFQLAEHAHEDYILWLDIIKKSGSCLGIQADMARYRIVENSRSMSVNRSGSRWKVYRNFEGLGVWDSTVNFFIYGFTALGKRFQF